MNKNTQGEKKGILTTIWGLIVAFFVFIVIFDVVAMILESFIPNRVISIIIAAGAGIAGLLFLLRKPKDKTAEDIHSTPQRVPPASKGTQARFVGNGQMNPYELLRVPMDAAPETIVSAFRKAAEAAHPDLHPGDPNASGRFYAIVDAFNILCDPKSRYELDQRLMAGAQGVVYKSENFNHSEGFQKYSAEELMHVISMIRTKTEEARAEARKYALSGLAWFAGGLAVTIISEIVGFGVLAWGAILFGGIEAFRGLKAYISVGRKASKVKDQFWMEYLRN